MESITFGQCVKGAWRDGWRYVRYQPWLVLAVLVMAWFAPFVEAALRPNALPPFRFIAYVPLGIFELLQIALCSALTVQAVRFVLLGRHAADAEPLISRNYWRYLGFTYGLILLALACMAAAAALAFGVVILLALFHIDYPVLVPILMGGGVAAAGVAGFFLGIRLSLLSTHMAIGGAVRFRETWADTRGHCWSIGLTQTIATLPMFAVAYAVVSPRLAMAHHGLAAVGAFGGALAGVGAVCAGAACSAWLYLRYASALARRR